MLLSAYHHSGHNQKTGLDDSEATLSKTEQQLSARMKIVDIAVKQNRTVPVLLTPDVVKAIDCILSSLEKIGIDDDNEFFFARISRPNSIDVCSCMRRVAERVGVERPELIRSTKL